MRSTRMLALALLALPTVAMTGAPGVEDDMHQEVLNTIATFKQKDPGIQKFFDGAVGYAVFPTIGKGAIGIGGAHGKGELIVGGKAVGKTSMTQVTIGFQLGGQAYSEIIFFQKKETLDGFKKSDFAFAAEVSAVALTSGASANAAYRNGVAVFTAAKGGLMYEASVGGQKFSYKPY
jgi:lipid-binding SYLF domain-containing protein